MHIAFDQRCAMAQDLPQNLPDDDYEDLIMSDPERRPNVYRTAPSRGEPGFAAGGRFDPSDASSPDSGRRGFTVQPGGRNANAIATAQAIGSAMGTAQRQMLRGLELVQPLARRVGLPFSGSAAYQAGQAGFLEQESPDLVSRMMRAFEDEVAETRRQAARRLDQLSGFAGERLQQFRGRVSDDFARSRLRARQISADYPVPIVAAIAGISFACGIALGRRSRRR
jgi:hypothetical protein